jgi:hypothetical protein
MKIVMVRDWSEEWVASGTETLPLEYASAEQAIVDFETLAREARTLYLAHPERPRTVMFEFAGFRFDFSKVLFETQSDVEAYLPQFLTVDEWFDRHGAKAVGQQAPEAISART